MLSRSRSAVALAGAAAVAATMVATASPASARPDTDCQRAGLSTLKDAGLLPTVARTGLPIAVAGSVGVTVRPGADISGVPDPIPLSLVLADHRAGDESLFLYPWC